MTYIISTDTTADLSEAYVDKHNLPLLSFNYTINGITYDLNNELPYKDFCNNHRQSSHPGQ